MKKVFKHVLFSTLFSTMCFAQWTQVPTSPPGWFQNIIVVNDTLYISNISNGIYKSTDGTTTWQQINNGLNNTESRQVFEVIKFSSDLYAATVDGIYKSTNNGNEWVKKSNGITIGPGALKEFCESIFEYQGVLFTGAYNGIYCSTDNAENWIITNISGTHVWAKIFINHNGILFATRESINTPNGFKSFDNGLTWEVLTGMNFPTITFFSEPPALWAGTIHGAWLSTDNGLTWVSRSNGLSPDPYNSSFVRVNGRLITSLKFGGSGMFRSSDEGLNWENWGEGLLFLSSIEKIIVYKDKIIAATSNGLWQRDTSEVISAITDERVFPQEFKLFQNYPNPFNPTTNISFELPMSGYTTLKVYDMLGNEVATLVKNELTSGIHTVNFDAANLASGTYVYQLNVNGTRITNKMVLLK
jgi:hypothetical protein